MNPPLFQLKVIGQTILIMDLISFLVNLRARLPLSDPEAFRTVISETLGYPDFKIHVERSNGDSFRAIISKHFSRGDFTKKITHQCDGIVINNSGDVLALPLQRYNPFANHGRVATALAAGKYTVQKVFDGSIVTLYYYNSSWRISSASGYDVTNIKWIGDKTYDETLKELLPADFYSKLDTDKCYTIGFRHLSFHPLQSDPARVWFMQAVDLGALNCDSPHEVYISDGPLPSIEQVEVKNLDGLVEENARALAGYYSTGNLHYGYMLRGDFAELGDIANVMLESTLMKAVRQIFYNNTKHIERIKLTNENRIKHIALRAYLTHNQKYDFIQLFPQFKSHYDSFDSIFKDIMSNVKSALRSTDSKKKLESFRRVPNDYRRHGVIMEVSQYIFQKFESRQVRGFNPRKPDADSIIMDQITDRSQFVYYCNTVLKIEDRRKNNPAQQKQ